MPPPKTSPKISLKTLNMSSTAIPGEVMHADAVEAAVAVAVVAVTFLGIGKDLVRLGGLLESLVGAGLLVPVGMVLERSLTEGPLDLVRGRRCARRRALRSSQPCSAPSSSYSRQSPWPRLAHDGCRFRGQPRRSIGSIVRRFPDSVARIRLSLHRVNVRQGRRRRERPCVAISASSSVLSAWHRRCPRACPLCTR